MTTERRYDIDWLRVIAIGLLLIYHIAIVFQPWAMFIGFVRSDAFLEDLWKPMTMLNVWRIPFLFYVSGMGLYFAMRKRNWKQLILERSKRILLPFLFGIVAIAPLHMYVFQKMYNMPLSYYPHMGHLWFLGNIFLYVLILLPLFVYLKKQDGSAFKTGLTKMMKSPLGPLAVIPFFILEAMLVKPQLFSLYAQTWHGFYLGLLAFFFGFLFMYSGKTFWSSILKWRWLYIAIAAVLFVVRYVEFATEAPGYLTAIESNCWIFGVFGLGYKYLNKPSKRLSYLSKAAYPVYIIHMFVLFASSLLVLPFKLPPYVSLVLIIGLNFLGCFVIYELLIKRISFLRPLFGLNWDAKPKQVLKQKLKSEKVEV
ncbi:MAG: acyltransferase [Bacteroidetes bacterium MedPE-SWsnd-G2]|nr:MAG: acyltransferase [Bacteroidetes bacterium MedPE-SWsnd-G2]